MPNRHRGEIAATLDGRPFTLCLTLGALAELEDAFGAEDMLALAERFERGRLSANDAARIIAAGLGGAGHVVGLQDVLAMRHERGASGFVDIVARLLQATFSDETSSVDRGGSGTTASGAALGEGAAERRPSPGRM